jgi:hypothetical protein
MTEYDGNIRQVTHEDRCRAIYELVDTARISYGVYQQIVAENLSMRGADTQFVLRFVTKDHKQRRGNVS